MGQNAQLFNKFDPPKFNLFKKNQKLSLMPKFYYSQKVKIINGFYRNLEGSVIDYYNKQYNVSISIGYSVRIDESDLEAL